MAGSGFDHLTSAQTMWISTILANGGFGKSARVLLFKPTFICAPKGRTDRSGHGKRGSGTLSSVQEGAEP